MNIEKAIKLPFSEDGLVKVIIGAILNLIPIVNFLSFGYLIELMANVIQGREDMPVWDDWGNKFIKGLMVAVISFIYFIIPMLVMMLGGGLAILTGSSGSFLFSIIGFLLILVVWFILPMALANYAATDNFGSAFAFGEIFALISGSMGQYLTVFGLSIAAAIVMSIIGMIPLLGWIVILLGGFYIGIVVFFLIGQIYRSGGSAA